MVTEIIEKLSSRNKTVAVAESCTGGMVCSMLVEQAGASACFAEGYVTYSNEAKEKNLGVSHAVLESFGAVSEQTARQMAEGVRRRAEADYGLATTGIAGPDGLWRNRWDWYILHARTLREQKWSVMCFTAAEPGCVSRRRRAPCISWRNV